MSSLLMGELSSQYRKYRSVESREPVLMESSEGKYRNKAATVKLLSLPFVNSNSVCLYLYVSISVCLYAFACAYRRCCASV